MSIDYSMMTKKGNREVNEDSAICVEHSGNFCFVVADGLGGHGRGDEASNAAVKAFEREFLQDAQDADEFIRRAFAAAQKDVLDMQKVENAHFGMKTTAVALAVVDGKCVFGHIGDSRLYVFKKGKIAQRTLDHSVTQMLALTGEISEKKIRGHPDRNKLFRVIGVEWDSYGFAVSDEYDLSECQAFLLCSDGFWEFIDERRMCAALKKSADADEWASAMITEVEKNGAAHDMDNYTVITVIG